MFKLKFMLLLVVTAETVADEADFSDTEICTDPTKNNCDANAKCTRAVGGVNTDQCTPKFFCECNDGYTGEGTKGCCQKPCPQCPLCPVCPECPKPTVPVLKDAVCAANCDFTKESLCNYKLPGVYGYYTATIFSWTNSNHVQGDTDTTMDNFFYLGWRVSAGTNWDALVYSMSYISIGSFGPGNSVKETKVHLTVRTSSPDVKLSLLNSGTEVLIDFGSTRRGWYTVTGTLPANYDGMMLRVDGQGSQISEFGIRKIEVEANC